MNIIKPTFFLVAAAATTIAFGATATFKSRESAGMPGNFKYTYEYKCNSGKTGVLSFSAANDNEANLLAETEANERCGE
jgi:ABC-type phosphate transport system substrate-binding protein